MRPQSKTLLSLVGLATVAAAHAGSAPAAAISSLLPTFAGQNPPPDKGGIQGRFNKIPAQGTVQLQITPSGPITFDLWSMRYHSKDDPFLSGDDEPYMINFGFKAKLIFDGLGHAKVDPATIAVSQVAAAGQNDLGRSGDGWAEGGTTYNISAGNQKFTTTLVQEPNWIAGMLCTFWEEDNFSSTQVRLTRDQIQRQLNAALKNMNLAGLSDKVFSQQVGIRLVNDIRAGFRNWDFTTILKGIASTVNPDDYGGANLVLAATFPNNEVKAFAGSVTATDNFVNMQTVPRPGTGGNQVLNLAMVFPPGDLPGNYFARYTGKCTISTTVRRG